MKTKRRSVIKKMLTSFAGLTGLAFAFNAKAYSNESRESLNITSFKDIPLYSGSTRYGNFLFVSGTGAHVPPFTIKAHTKLVIDKMEEELKKSGSSLEKVVKVNVYLDDIADYDAMNEEYRGRFGDQPPVRTTVAVAKGGLPGKSLVEMDCMAYI